MNTLAARQPILGATPRRRSPGLRRLKVFGANQVAVVGVVLSLALGLAAAGAPLIATHDPFVQNAANRLEAPSALYIMGRDTFGRDVFARVLHAGRVSLAVGLGSVAVGGTLGTLVGLVAGYRGRRIESYLMRALDVVMAFPSLLLGLAVLTVLGAGVDKLIVSIGVVLAPPFARVVHATTLSLKNREFVEAARCLGAGPSRIVIRHILPSLLGETVVLASLLTASAIRIEASLSFIGLGVSPPTPTWGNMIRDGAPVLPSAPWLSTFPGLAILVSVLAFNLVGDGIRDVLDPLSQR